MQKYESIFEYKTIISKRKSEKSIIKTKNVTKRQNGT